MRKIIKYIPGFMLWLASLVFCAHMIIPHDHHNPGAFSDQDENCPFSNKRSGHHQGFPVHCHAFNELISEKFSLIHFLPVIQYSYISLTDTTAGSSFELQISYFDTDAYQEPLPDCLVPGSSLFRAPPSLA
jgi:hypothetical protein